MKNLFKSLLVAVMAVGLMVGSANAGWWTPNVGNLDVNAAAGSIAVDGDINFIPNGISGGISAAGGGALSGAKGIVTNGHISGDVTAVGGGITNTDAYNYHPGIGDVSIGTGVRSDSEAVTGATLIVHTDAQFGEGLATGIMVGAAGEGTLVGSGLIQSPIYFDSKGFTVGIAGQGAVGGFAGEAVAGVFLFGSADAKAGALITMNGFSQSDSWRAVDWGDGSKTERMGTNVGAGTNVIATGYANDSDRCLAYGNANVCGGWIAKGGAATLTVQSAPGLGGAIASATGSYSAKGGLNSGFTGSAIGYSQTSVTTFTGMNGSINSAAAGMSVTSGPAVIVQ